MKMKKKHLALLFLFGAFVWSQICSAQYNPCQHNAKIISMYYDHSEKQLITCDDDEIIYWSIPDGKIVRKESVNSSQIFFDSGKIYNPNSFFIAPNTNTVRDIHACDSCWETIPIMAKIIGLTGDKLSYLCLEKKGEKYSCKCIDKLTKKEWGKFVVKNKKGWNEYPEFAPGPDNTLIYRFWAGEDYEFHIYDFATNLDQLIVKIPARTKKNGVPVESNISLLVNKNRNSVIIGGSEVYEYNPTLIQFVHKTTLDADYEYTYFDENTIIGKKESKVALFSYPDGVKINEFSSESSAEVFYLDQAADKLFIAGGEPTQITMHKADGTTIKNIEDKNCYEFLYNNTDAPLYKELYVSNSVHLNEGFEIVYTDDLFFTEYSYEKKVEFEVGTKYKRMHVLIIGEHLDDFRLFLNYPYTSGLRYTTIDHYKKSSDENESEIKVRFGTYNDPPFGTYYVEMKKHTNRNVEDHHVKFVVYGKR
jgi:hypothetical protein